MSVVLITGTSTGIGLETAILFAQKGHQVYATMRNLDRSSLLRERSAEAGVKPTILQLDVTDNVSVQRATAEVLANEGRIDVLVNNAGVEGALVGIEEIDDDLIRSVFDANVFGVLRATRAVLPAMRRQGSGCIVNVSSIAGLVSPAGLGPYTSSKHALESLSESLALEVCRFGIRVAIVEPGTYGTPMLDRAVDLTALDADSPYADAVRRMHTIFVMGRQANANPREVAETIERAVSTDQPKLRYLVGVDAEVFAAGRNRISDEEWVEFGRAMSEEEYWTEFARLFPMPAPV